MLRSLRTILALLIISAVILFIAVVMMLFQKDKADTIADNKETKLQASVPDPSKMNAAEKAHYDKMKEGEKLFKDAGCSSCHDLNSKKVGPALHGVTKRRSKEWIYSAVTNMPKLIENQDKDAVQLFKEYQAQMPPHSFLNKEEIDRIMDFIEYK